MISHIQDGELLRALDGELPRGRAACVKEHLESCWICRTRLHDLEGTIDQFVHAQVDELEPLIPEIEGPRALLRARIALRETTEKNSWVAAWKSFARWRTPFAVAAALAIAASVAVLLVTPSPHDGHPVSEVLQKAETSEKGAISSRKRPVTYQKLDVQFAGRRYERVVYLDKSRSRSVVNVRNLTRPSESDAESSRALAPVEQVFSGSALDWKEPLSPSRMSHWRNALRAKTDRISSGPQFTEVVTRTSEGPIAEAQVRFRNADFHPVAETLRLRNSGVVEIAELDYGVLELSELRADFFDRVPGTLFATAPPRIPVAGSSSADNLKLELEVVERLDRARALLGGQIAVERRRNGVSVDGIVDDQRRKSQIFAALGPAVKDPALKVAIATPGGMRAPVKDNDNIVSVEGVDTFQKAPADEQLHAFFAQQAGNNSNADEAVQHFTADVSMHSQLARSHAAVLRQIAEQFTLPDLREMTPTEHRQWRSMLRSHALSVLSETRSMRENLEPIFRANVEDRRPLVGDPATDADLINAAVKLSALAASNDSAVWHSFAASVQASRVTLVCLPEFWDSLLDTEILAQQVSAAASE